MTDRRFTEAYDAQGHLICGIIVVDMGRGRKAALLVTRRLMPYWRRIMKPYMKGTKKVRHGEYISKSLKLALASWQLQEAAFYRLMRPFIGDGRRADRTRVLKLIGVYESTRTTFNNKKQFK